MLDVDHLFDYYANHGPTVNIKKLYITVERVDLKRIFLLLHSYELLIFLVVLIYIFSLGDVWKALGIGVVSHVVVDQISNPVKPLAYFLTYRVAKKFEKEAFVKDDWAYRG